MEFDEEIVRRIQSVAGNEICADCETKEPDWASVNTGVLLCVRCSGAHRSLGTHISQVKSLKLDNWTEELIKKMESLGNSKVNQVLEFHLPKYIPKPREYPNSDALRKRYVKWKYELKRFTTAIEEEEDRKLLGQKEGFMLKQSKKDSNKFQKRWLVLSEGALSYFRTSDSETPAGIISLGPSARLNILNPLDFSISSNIEGREYVFRSNSNDVEEVLDWICAIRASISREGRGSIVRRVLGTVLEPAEGEDEENAPGSSELRKEAFKVLGDGHFSKGGWLGKRSSRGGMMLTWPKRYFVLVPEGILYYFRTPMSMSKWKDPIGALSVVGACIEADSQKPNSFAIRCAEGQLLLCAESEEDQKSWISALKTASESISCPPN